MNVFQTLTQCCIIRINCVQAHPAEFSLGNWSGWKVGQLPSKKLFPRPCFLSSSTVATQLPSTPADLSSLYNSQTWHYQKELPLKVKQVFVFILFFSKTLKD